MTRRASWAYACGLVVLSVLLARSLFVVPYLPTNDGPEHVIATHLENHYSDPGTLYADVLTPSTEFAARGFTLLYGPLYDAFGWRVGLQWATAIMALTSALGFVALVRAVQPGRWPLAFLGFPLALTWELYMGFFPFTVGSGVGLFILALAAAWRDPTGRQRLLLALLLLLQGVCHVFAAVLTGLVLAILFLWRAHPKRRLCELGRVALMGLPAALLLLASAWVGRGLTKSTFAEHFLILPLAEIPAVLPRIIAPGPAWRALVITLVLAAVVAAGVRFALTRDASPTDRGLLAAGILFLAAGAFAPMNIPGWQFLSPRFVPLGVLLCLVAFPVERLTRPYALDALAATLFALSLAWLVSSSALHRRLAAACADAIAGLAAPVERHTLWLPITLAPEGGLSPYPEVSEVPYLAPLRHMPVLYAVAEGGLTPYTFANNGATYSFVIRKGIHKAPPIPQPAEYAPLIESDAFDVDPALRHKVVGELATYAMRFEGALVTGAQPADVALMRERGFAEDWARGSVFIGHFVPCPLDIAIPSEGDAPNVDVGVEGAAILHYEARPAALEPNGTRHLTLPGAPCGKVRVRPHWDSKSVNGAVAHTYCANADGNGDLFAKLTWSDAKVVCQ